MKTRRLLPLALALASVGMVTTNTSRSARAQDVLPAGFSESLVANGMPSPTAMEFAPDGRLFVALQGGRVRIVKNGAALANDFLRITVDSQGERGLVGLTFDPNFSSNRLIYIYYTVPGANGSAPHNRVSRVRASASNPDVVEPNSEQILFELENLTGATNHNGGAMHFGPDGKLYVAVGENATASNSQSDANLLGKMLRLNSDGSIPADNPYPRQNNRLDARWAKGLRNPFTFGFDPASGQMLINDVGGGSWEEINVGVAGSNYGWPNTEGPTDNPAFRTPLHAYRHGNNGAGGEGYAITGGVFYRGAQFPAAYTGKYFYSDYVFGWIRVLDPSNGSTQPFAAPRGNVAGVDLDVAPDGSLYVLSFNQGAVLRIAYTTAPAISQQPASQSVSAGESVTFSVAANGAGPISYQWQRNGAGIAGATSPTYSLTASNADNGAQFRCVVTNPNGQAISSAATLSVRDSRPPVPVIDAPGAGALYRAGETISFSGSASDAEDGALAPANLSWRIDFHHDTHSHPALAETPGIASGSFAIPTIGETADNVFYRITLTARDASGLTASTSRDVLPRKARINLATIPSGLGLTLDGAPIGSPSSTLGVVGIQREIGAPTQTVGGITYSFRSWSDGGAQVHNIATPEADATHTARFGDDRAPSIALNAGFSDGLTVRSLSTISGTASDEGVGLERVVATLRRLRDGAYWNGSAWALAPSTYDVSGLAAWSAGLPALENGSYSFGATATDAGGASTSTPLITFTIDSSAPVISFSASLSNGAALTAFPILGGSVSENTSRVEISIRRSDGLLWVGNAWLPADRARPLLAAISGTSWRMALVPLGVALRDGAYSVSATAFDAAGNIGRASTTIRIARPIVDRTAPRIVLGSPAPNAILRSQPLIIGRAADASGVSVFLNLYRVVTINGRAQWQIRTRSGGWNSNLSLNPQNDLPIASTRAATLNWSATLPFLPSGRYATRAIAIDPSGNRAVTGLINWTLDRDVPRATITSPTSGVSSTSLATAQGRALDIGTGVRGVSVILLREGVGYWDGRGWTPTFSAVNERPATITSREVADGVPSVETQVLWSIRLPALPAGKYQISAVATDNAAQSTRTAPTRFTIASVSGA